MDNVNAAAVGARLAGRLTPDLILRSPQYMNCVQKYEIDLRGNKISVIENLGATEDQFDCMDLSDNAVVFLEGFPKLNRLKVLLLNNNRISRISKSLHECLPNLEMLILTNNRIEQLHILDPLGAMKKLNHISLIGNPVTKLPNYRQYVVQLMSKLTVLDFTKVKPKERQIMEDVGHTFDPDKLDIMETEGKDLGVPSPSQPKGPTPEQITAIKAAIQNASTLEEVRRLERALKSGVIPSETPPPGEDVEMEEELQDTEMKETT